MDTLVSVNVISISKAKIWCVCMCVAHIIAFPISRQTISCDDQILDIVSLKCPHPQKRDEVTLAVHMRNNSSACTTR